MSGDEGVPAGGYVAAVLGAGGLASTGVTTGMMWAGVAAVAFVVAGAVVVRFARRRRA